MCFLYLDSVRRNRQLIIVTNNPLLVVNLDVDNVVHLTKTNKFIDIKVGCLEDEDNGIIELVAKTLDGGKDMIEKRIRILYSRLFMILRIMRYIE